MRVTTPNPLHILHVVAPIFAGGNVMALLVFDVICSLVQCLAPGIYGNGFRLVVIYY